MVSATYAVSGKGKSCAIPGLALTSGSREEASLVIFEKYEQCQNLADGKNFLRRMLTQPFLLDSFCARWQEEAILAEAFKKTDPRQCTIGTSKDVRAHLSLGPARPLGDLLWGCRQDEEHGLTLQFVDKYYRERARRATRSKLDSLGSLSRFQGLLYLSELFYAQDDDTTVIADGFPILARPRLFKRIPKRKLDSLIVKYKVVSHALSQCADRMRTVCRKY